MSWTLSESDVLIMRRMAAKFRRDNPKPTPPNSRTPRDDGGSDIKFGKVVNADIIPDTETGEAEIWDITVTPPVATGEIQSDLVFDWLSDEQISVGKEIAWTNVGGLDRILWAECEDPPVKPASFILDGIMAPVSGGTTARVPLAPDLGTADDFIIVGGNQLQAVHDISSFKYEFSAGYSMIASSNNQELGFNLNSVIVSGTPTLVDIPLYDSFTTPRLGTFLRSQNLPIGRFANVTAGDTFAFDLTSDAVSSMDVQLDAIFIAITS